MTRENKLALVVGFGLILVVAILLSDHFSTARQQDAANLDTPVDPLTSERATDPALIDFAPAPPPPAGVGPTRHVATNTGHIRPRNGNRNDQGERRNDRRNERRHDEPVRQGPGHIEMPDLQAIAAQEEETAGQSHFVRRNESMTAICNTYYGDASLVDELAKFNGIADPNLVQAGHRLRIPDRIVLTGTPAPQRGGNDAPAARPSSYTVKSGDVLSQLAEDLLGSASRWRELYDLNRDVIRNPDHLDEGIVIRLPSSRG